MIKNKKVFQRKKTRNMLDENMKCEVKEWKFISLSLTLEREIYQDPKLHFCNNISGYFKLTTSFELINRRHVIKEKIGFWLDRMLNYLRYIHHILFNWTFTISPAMTIKSILNEILIGYITEFSRYTRMIMKIFLIYNSMKNLVLSNFNYVGLIIRPQHISLLIFRVINSSLVFY